MVYNLIPSFRCFHSLILKLMLLLYIHSDVKPAQARCYIALRASSVGAAQIRVESKSGRIGRVETVNIYEGNNVYCVQTVCPQSRTYPAIVSFHQPGRSYVVTCSGQDKEHSVLPGDPTCYGSYSACKRSNSPNLLFTNECSYI